MSERERLKEAVELATELSGDYVNFDHAMNRACSLLREGWGKPRTITTDAELDDLPEQTIIRNSWGDPLTKDNQYYWHYGEIPVMDVSLPATVLWEPND